MSAPEIIQAVRDIAEARPDFKYTDQDGYSSLEGCSYVSVRPGTMQGEGCIIGQALAKTGVDMETLKAEEFQTSYSPAVDTVAADHPHWFGGCTPADIHWMQTVQEHQDNGERWSMAVQLADDPTNQ